MQKSILKKLIHNKTDNPFNGEFLGAEQMQRIIEKTKLIIDIGLVISIFLLLFLLIGMWKALGFSLSLLLYLHLLNKVSRKKVLLPEIVGLLFACLTYFAYLMVTLITFGFSRIDNMFIGITGALLVIVFTSVIAFVFYKLKSKQAGL